MRGSYRTELTVDLVKFAIHYNQFKIVILDHFLRLHTRMCEYAQTDDLKAVLWISTLTRENCTCLLLYGHFNIFLKNVMKVTN